jgi:hypothetical protein
MALTDEQWALYEERYGKLMRTIALKISGDDAIANPEDNYSDLCIAAIESINGFKNKTGMGFDEAINTKLFDAYTKTVLWNRKAKKGIPLSKRMDFRNKHLSLDYQSGLDASDCGSLIGVIEDKRSNVNLSAIELGDFVESQKPEIKKILSEIIRDPNLIRKDGTINKTALEGVTGMNFYHVTKAIGDMKRVLGKEMSDEQ